MERRSFPTHVQIQTTTACGADCSICPHPETSPQWSNGLMAPGLFERIVEQLAGRDIEHLSPYLMADPLSDRLIFERVARLRQALPQTVLEISTTGKYLVPKLADRLLDAPLSELRISSHGISAAEYARTMPGVAFEQAMSHIERFIERWQKRQPYRLSIVCLWGLWPREREDEIEHFWAQRGVALSRWRVISRASQVDLTVFGQGSPDPRPFDVSDKGPGPYMCREQRDRHWMHILSDGRVTLCCMDYRQQEILGDARVQSLADIWDGPAFTRARNQIRDGGDVPGFLCDQCELHVSTAVHQAYESAKA